MGKSLPKLLLVGLIVLLVAPPILSTSARHWSWNKRWYWNRYYESYYEQSREDNWYQQEQNKSKENQVVAQETPETETTVDDNYVFTPQEEIKTEIEKRCEKLTSEFPNYKKNYESNRDKHLNRYKQIGERLQNLINKLKAEGIDVSKLETDLNNLNTKNKNFQKSYESYIKDMELAKKYACENDKTNYKKHLDLALKNFRATKAEAQGIVNFIKGTIIPHLKEL